MVHYFPTKPPKTKSVPGSKFQQRLGAKKTKKLELDERSEFTVSPEDATMYRALAAKCNYLAQNRPDIGFASKELRRSFSTPNMNRFNKLKCLAKYFVGMPRLAFQ